MLRILMEVSSVGLGPGTKNVVDGLSRIILVV